MPKYIVYELSDYVDANKYTEAVCSVFDSAGELLLYLCEFLSDNLLDSDYGHYGIAPNLVQLPVDQAIDITLDLGKNHPLDFRISHIAEIEGTIRVHEWMIVWIKRARLNQIFLI